MIGAVRPVLIFDLDGTLVDSEKDLTESVNHIRHQFDLPALTEPEIARFIGDGALMLIRRALGPQAAEPGVEAVLQMFRSYYRARMRDGTVRCPAVLDALWLVMDCELRVMT